jgi:Amt family ammonium transporter
VKLSKVTVLCNQAKFEQLKSAMNDIGVTGMTVAQVLGCGIQKGRTEYYRGVPLSMNLLPKLQVDMVVSKVPVAQVVDAARKALYPGHIGDGKIFVYGVEQAVKVRTNERGYDALQGEE